MTVPGATLAGLDAWVEELRVGVGGSGITRSDLIRDILARAVAEHAAGPKAKRIGGGKR
jgi:hypothetical protein